MFNARPVDVHLGAQSVSAQYVSNTVGVRFLPIGLRNAGNTLPQEFNCASNHFLKKLKVASAVGIQ